MFWLTALAIAGQGVVALLTLVLARNLELGEFEAYAVAAAGFVVMAAAAPLGAEKLALRVLPPLIERGDHGRVRGYLGWAAGRTLLGAAACAAVALAWAATSGGSPHLRLAVAAACLALPAAVLAHLGIEALTAAGQARFATLLFRLVVPGAALAGAGLAILAGRPGAVAALLAWGAGWTVAAALMLGRLAAVLPVAVRTAAPISDAAAWRRGAWPLWLYRIATAVMAQAAILALDWLGAPAAAVGAYAAASGVVALALVLATATNRAYASQLAVLLERGDFAGISALQARRLRWVVPVVGLFLVAVLGFAPRILRLFRPEFVAEGTLPLRLLALAAAISISFALAPTYLKYRGRNRAVLATVAGSALVQLALLGALVPPHGAAGAASAQALAIVLMFGAMALMAGRDLRRVRR